jgi:hypothetical protein
VAGDDLPGVMGAVCVLLEEDNVTDNGAAAGREALNAAVASALADIIATRSFSKPDITQEEIDQYMGAVRNAVSDAVRDQQSFVENLWSWLNEDDTIGIKVFFWTYDDLVGGDTVTFSQCWGDHGDWELFGHVNATVVCPVEAAAASSGVIEAVVAKAAKAMRSFRDQEVGGTKLQAWWSLAERNTAQIGYALHKNPRLVESAAALLQAMPELLKNRDAPLPAKQLGHARRILQHLREMGSHQTRVDASRALDVLAHLEGKTVRDTIALLRSVPPGRTPRPERDIGHLLDRNLRVPDSVLRPIEPRVRGRANPDLDVVDTGRC